jgi:dsDNA-specific endonuclease/ATPase MutS2
MFKIGEKVSVLDEDINGIVKSCKAAQIIIETTDGFILTYSANELIKTQNSSDVLDAIRRSDSVEFIKDNEVKKIRNFVKERKDKREIPAPEFDLHIEKLLPNKRGISNYDILTLQTETARRHIEFAMRNRIPKIVFIHGVGEGVLKAELDFLLGRYENIVFQDGNYQKYGFGATEVYFKQNTK